MPGVGSLLDDIHISGRSRTEHNQRLKRVLEILDAANLRAKAGKCVFAQRAIQYLGHRIDKDGLHMTDEHVRAIRDAPPPTDQDDNCADFLSRITWSKGAVETDPGNATTYLNYVNENSPFRLDWRSIQRETRTDVELAPVVSAIQRGDKMPSDDRFAPYKRREHELTVDKNATSKWIEAFQVPSTTASVAIEKLQEIFARFGLPRAITSDGAKCFTGTEFSEFLQLYGIVHLRGPPFHPQSNGFGESAVKIVKRSVQKALASGLKPTNLSRAVNNFLFQYRNTVHAAIMDTPAGLLLKKKPMTFFDLMIPSSESVVLERQASMVKNGGHRQVFLYPNDLVWVRDYRFGQPKWIKGHIQDVLGDQTFLVKTHDNNLWSRHLDQLWPGSPRKTAPDPNVSQPNLQSPKETSQTPNEKSQNTATSTAESSADFQGFSPPSQAIEKSPTTSTPISTPQRRTTRKIRKPLRFEPR
ncbi:Integrase core domain [Nesidiocoris tenuis]|uniref:Integrase core domain n=1 Tax=Nesidiocoris tenuis TaxID=355587 RepID=A0ABN7AKP4_9HEMI|nr:Integrase core domain [Nesidiocoris tenuis]